MEHDLIPSRYVKATFKKSNQINAFKFQLFTFKISLNNFIKSELVSENMFFNPKYIFKMITQEHNIVARISIGIFMFRYQLQRTQKSKLY